MRPAGKMDPEKLLEHAAWLRRLAFHLVRDAGAADELVQDTWAAALRRPPSTDRSVRPWLRHVITNVARFRWRGEHHRAARERAYHTLADGAAPSTAELLERHETQVLLARLVTELEEPFREAILLRYGEGLTPSQIARRLGIPSGTVRSRLSEGLERLRVRLDALHRGDRRAWILAIAPLGRREAPAAVPLLVLAIGIGVIALAFALVGTHGAAPAPGASRSPVAPGREAPADPARAIAERAWQAQVGAPPRHVAGRVVADGRPVTGAPCSSASVRGDPLVPISCGSASSTAGSRAGPTWRSARPPRRCEIAPSGSRSRP